MTIISFLNPTNLASEKERFFASDTYNPQLTYNWNSAEIEVWLAKEPEYSGLARAIQTQKADDIHKEAGKAFSTKMDEPLLLSAQYITSIIPKTFTTLPVEAVASAFSDAFAYFKLPYRVEISEEHGFNFRPMHEERKIVLSRHLNMQFFSLDGEIKHEVLHIIRFMNTEANTIPFSSRYLPTEEGLATYFQDYVGQDGESSLFQHASEYAVTPICMQGSLREAVEYLESIGFEKELAWQRAIRHKFGFQDSSKPGDNMKPSMYFYWQQKIKALSNQEKLRLLVGKIRLDELENFTSYRGFISEEKIKAFYNLT